MSTTFYIRPWKFKVMKVHGYLTKETDSHSMASVLFKGSPQGFHSFPCKQDLVYLKYWVLPQIFV